MPRQEASRHSRAEVHLLAPLARPPRPLPALLVPRNSTPTNPALLPLLQIRPGRQTPHGFAVLEARGGGVLEGGAGGEAGVGRRDEVRPVLVLLLRALCLPRRKDAPALQPTRTRTRTCGALAPADDAHATGLFPSEPLLERLEPGFPAPQQRGLGRRQGEEDRLQRVRRSRGRVQSGEGGGEGLLEEGGGALVRRRRAGVLGRDVLVGAVPKSESIVRRRRSGHRVGGDSP